MIGIAVGHSRHGDQGAVNTDGVSEHEFNSSLVPLILSNLRVRSTVYDDYKASSYVGAMSYVARKMREDGVTACVELHFNSAGPKATGHEWLYWGTSKGGIKLAGCFNEQMKQAYPELKARGLKSKWRGSRGATFLRRTPCPAVIAEPFFGSNPSDVAIIQSDLSKLASVIAEGINNYYGR